MRFTFLTVLSWLSLWPLSASASSAKPPAPPGILDILDEAHSYHVFTRLLTETGLGITLSTDAGYTVFAPDDAAFAAFPANKLAFLEEPEYRDRLKSVMQRYIAVKSWKMSDLAGKPSDLQTLGSPLRFDGAATPPTVEGVPLKGAPITTAGGSIIYPLGGLLPTDKHLYDRD